LIRNNHAEEAERWVEKLEFVTRDRSLRERLLSLKTEASWLTAVGRNEAAKNAVETFGDLTEGTLTTDDEKKMLFAGLGQIHSDIQAHQLAEPWYRKLFELDPNSYRPFAIGLAHLNQHREAIDLVFEKLGTDHQQLELLDVLINILSAGQPNDEAWLMTDPVWTAAEADQSGNILFRMFASAARAMQGDERRAIEIMTALRIENPDSPLVLNNLATLLGQTKGKQSEALAFIDHAIQIAGPKPSLLDTKSVILVEMGKADEAVKVLKHLVAIPQPDPRILLRLAVASMRSNSPAPAVSFYRRALAAGLESQVLTQRDRELMKELSEL
jgi:tetratricopeptide (TPR) repeat protein